MPRGSGIRVRLEMKPEQVLAVRGLAKGNPVAQKRLTSMVARLSDPYTPFQGGDLKNQKTIETTRIIYRMPYAKFQYHGKVMVGIKSGSPWAMRGERKIVTPDALQHHGAPMRGPFWDKRMWIDRGEEILKSITEITGGRGEK